VWHAEVAEAVASTVDLGGGGGWLATLRGTLRRADPEILRTRKSLLPTA